MKTIDHNHNVFEGYVDNSVEPDMDRVYENISRRRERMQQSRHLQGRFTSSRGKLSKADKKYILERDENTCQYCGDFVDDNNLHIDHVIPVSQKGSGHLNNLNTSCQRCNQSKGAKTPEEWYEFIEKKYLYFKEEIERLEGPYWS